jgi:hypothetical protein
MKFDINQITLQLFIEYGRFAIEEHWFDILHVKETFGDIENIVFTKLGQRLPFLHTITFPFS